MNIQIWATFSVYFLLTGFLQSISTSLAVQPMTSAGGLKISSKSLSGFMKKHLDVINWLKLYCLNGFYKTAHLQSHVCCPGKTPTWQKGSWRTWHLKWEGMVENPCCGMGRPRIHPNLNVPLCCLKASVSNFPYSYALILGGPNQTIPPWRRWETNSELTATGLTWAVR